MYIARDWLQFEHDLQWFEFFSKQLKVYYLSIYWAHKDSFFLCHSIQRYLSRKQTSRQLQSKRMNQISRKCPTVIVDFPSSNLLLNKVKIRQNSLWNQQSLKQHQQQPLSSIAKLHIHWNFGKKRQRPSLILKPW